MGDAAGWDADEDLGQGSLTQGRLHRERLTQCVNHLTALVCTRRDCQLTGLDSQLAGQSEVMQSRLPSGTSTASAMPCSSSSSSAERIC